MLTPARLDSPEPLAHYDAASLQFVETSRTLRFSYVLLLLFLVFLYSNPALLVPSLERLRPTQALAGLALFTLFVEMTIARRNFVLVWPQGHLLLLFAGAAALSCIGALWLRLAVESTTDVMKFIAIAVIIMNTVVTVRHLAQVFAVLVVGGLFPALGTLNNYAHGVLHDGRAGWVGVFENPNELAYGLVILLPLAAALASGQRRAVRFTLYGVIGVFVAAIYTSFSRGGILGLVFVFGAMAIRQKSQITRVALFAALIVIVVVVSLFWTRADNFDNLESDFTVHQRLSTIRAGLASFVDHPIAGVGIGCSIVAWALYAPVDVGFREALHNHNTLIQALSEVGLVGFIPFILLFVTSIATCRRLVFQVLGEPRLSELAQGLEIALYGFLVCGMSGGYVLSWFPYILIGLVAAARRAAVEGTDAR